MDTLSLMDMKQEPADGENRLFAALAVLLKAPDRKKSFKSVEDSLRIKISEANHTLGFENLAQSVDPLIQQCGPLPESNTSDTAWDFSCVTLSILFELKNILKDGALLSVQHKSHLRAAAQFLSALGVSPLLQPGVGIPLESRCNAPITFPRNDTKKLSYLLRAILCLMQNKNTDIYSVFTANLMLDILAGLFQLSHEDKSFKLETSKFIRSTHPPTVMKYLLLLLKPNPKCPKWFLLTTTSYLNKCLMSPGGVISTVRALHDVQSEHDVLEKYAKTARIILQPDFARNAEYYKKLCPQVLYLLNSSNEEYKKVASEIVQGLHLKNAEFCHQGLFFPICQVFEQDFGDLEGRLILDQEQEIKISSSVELLILLISHSKISPDVLSRHFNDICAFYLATRKTGGTPALRCRTKDLLSQVIVQAEEASIWHTISTLPEDCLESLSEDSAVAQAMFSNFLKRFSTVDDLQEKMLLVSLLSSLAGLPSVQDEFMKKPSDQLINLLKVLLEGESAEILDLALMLLLAIISHSEDNLKKCQKLLPAVQKLRTSKHISEETKILVEQTFAIIATFGAVSGDVLLVEKKLKKMFKEKKKIEEIKPQKPQQAGPAKLSFKESLEEAADEEIPVKGHGYLSLTKLIRNKDQYSKEQAAELFQLAVSGMEHDDSYVYLAAVGMMSALILENLALLPKLAENYNKQELSLPLRNRIGEALLQVCKNLGEVAGSQRQILLNVYLSGAKDANPTHRASSLSNLGEACKVLGYRVSSDLQEILLCAQGLSTSDPDMHVRRAAALLLALLLQGLGTQAVNTLGSSSLDVYRTMKELAQSSDETLRLQAQLALEELNRGIKESIFKPQPMERHIYITSPPPI
ncbi:Hypothetical predicted protein [Cloeon dipterum]|uniref:RNA polymerase II assembly factor Rtp1 C-terminal domain-containing protein n=1 Tax=Cloeon dipterum TaxID=197152 RepID=A0A8S1CW96_9INSE|nr:Hypothetical predicted protein [Cloeon dipterum]